MSENRLVAQLKCDDKHRTLFKVDDIKSRIAVHAFGTGCLAHSENIKVLV